MNDDPLPRLFAAARREPPPPPPGDFAVRTAALARAQPRATAVLDQLEQLFPRWATVALVVMGACVAADLAHAALGTGPDWTDGVAQLCDRWEFPENLF